MIKAKKNKYVVIIQQISDGSDDYGDTGCYLFSDMGILEDTLKSWEYSKDSLGVYKTKYQFHNEYEANVYPIEREFKTKVKRVS